ncbi:MAG TPA: 4-(cytidine 5'-diphospho)-2-C-methyl-D-erythritol kinase [Candidatus Polarisedimenticolia bacterium]|nr:4-(cytidine 5'-diphospho)-2-C-methyl-D-erythritol kinase [Candidatus Polarisedimenticolia bacterium]
MGQRHPRSSLHPGDPGRVREPDALAVSGGPGSQDQVEGRRPARLQVPAHAKINLCLRILGRRPDGLHELESLVQTVDLHDDLTFEARPEGITIDVDDPTVPSGPENLAFRAAAALPAPASPPRGVHIRIRKAIPAGSGLGGGSSDAAATLLALRRLWGLDLSQRRLEEIAATLGADVPFFLCGGTALLTGTGSVVEPLPDLGGYEVLIVFPGLSLSTREVYAKASESLTSALRISSMATFKPTLKGSLAEEVEAWVRAGNDLEESARALCPAIGEIKAHLQAVGAGAAAMTGSGSAVFGIFRNPGAIGRASAEARARGFRTIRCAPLKREEFRRRVG